MKTRLFLLLAGLALSAPPATAQADRAPRAFLPAFRSDSELLSYVKGLAAERQRYLEEERRRAEAAANCRGRARVSRARPGKLAHAAVISGRVLDESGSPLAGALMSLEPFDTSTVAAEDGRFRLGLPAARLTQRRRVSVMARFIGYRPFEHSLTVRPGDSVEVVLTVCPSVGTAVMALEVSTGFAAQRSITNTQHTGVDEGAIVKLHGDHLVILRRGRLFTVAIRGDSLRPIAAVDAFGPGIDPRRAWYDELLLWKDKVVVVGYSYDRGGTELGVFRIDRSGSLRHLATYQLRSHDYYSSRNYASRLVGNTLVFYAPLYLPLDDDDPLASMPGLRRWNPRDGGRFERIATPQRTYLAGSSNPYEGVALHTVTSCDLAARELTCQATVVIGPWGRVFYVSPSAVYVWMSGWPIRGERHRWPAVLCRMPLDGSAPSALRVTGTPVDQFSFLESEDGHLNVVVRSMAYGDQMWGAEFAWGTTALMRVPLDAFGDTSRATVPQQYRTLPTGVSTESYRAYTNRFVGDYVLYGLGSGWGTPRGDTASLYVVPWRGGAVSHLVLPHAVDRIEVMGGDAVVIGADEENLHFTGIRLVPVPEVNQRYTVPGASQGELRSHGFFYRPDDAGSGVLGLPVRGPGKPGYRHLLDESSSVVFLRNDGARFLALGELAARAGRGKKDDACRASCVDWYGNSRPLFIDGRVMALLGYELVEGRIEAGQVHEMGRIDFTPQRSTATRR